MNTAQKSPAQPARILLVDDNHFGNVARKTVLEEQGFDVASALSGEEGLKLCLEQRFDLVVTDLKMNVMSGLDLIEHLRGMENPPRLILLSGWAVCLGLDEQSSGADAVLAKSNKEQDQLLRTVRQLLARRPGRKPAASQKRSQSSVARSG